MTQVHLTSRYGQPVLAQIEIPPVCALNVNSVQPHAVQEALSPTMKPVNGIAFTTNELRDARLRRAYAADSLSDGEIEKVKSIDGWTWHPLVARDILALWSVNIEDDLDEGRGPDNHFVRQRVEEVHRIRLNGLRDPAISDIDSVALRSIDNEVIRGYIEVPRDTVRMAAADLVEWVYGEFNPDNPKEEERIAGYAEYVWTRDYLEVIHQFVAPEKSSGVLDTDTNGYLKGDKNPLRWDILLTFFRAFLDRSKDVCDGSPEVAR